MVALTWQTLLVLVLAYFAGCIVGCFARKMKGAAPSSAGRAPAGSDGLVLARVGADAGPSSLEALVPPRPSAPERPAQEAFRRADSDAPSDAAPPAPAVQSPRPMPPRAAHPAQPPIVAPPVSAAAAVAAARSASVPAPGDDLTRIRAIDRALEAKLHDAGVTRYGEIATWTSDQVKAISETLGFEGRIERENWIEQAHILARGGVTQYATTIARTTQPPASTPAVIPIAPASPPDVATRAAFAEPRSVAPMAPAVAAPSVGGRENLQRIGGISAEVENVLNAHGVTRYSQVAGWSSSDIARLEGLLGFSGRINRENWIEQAQILANGGATAYSREVDRAAGITVAPPPPAPPLAAAPSPPSVAPPTIASPPAAVVAPTAPAPAPPPAAAGEISATASGAAERSQILAGMRSVRSEAYRGEDHFAPPRSARAPDDLKRIRGIGVLLERKLNAMGVTTYEQIANWTADDVGTVNSKLEFKGRIERENWIEQARILASGGHTDFSRRFERGEV